MDWRALNAKRIWNVIVNDRRMRATTWGYILPAWSLVFFRDFGMERWWLGWISHISVLFLMVNLLAGYRHYKFTCQAFLLGSLCALSVAIGLTTESLHLRTFCLYIYVFSMFHFSEFFVTGLTNIDTLKVDSFLLNHSKEYWIAATSAWIEFAVEAYFFPGFLSPRMTHIGLFMTIAGELMRKLAMCHATSGFTHQIAYRKQKNHTLVTTGVYGLCRHPGYLGWILWSVGTQMILCNPICAALYTYITFNFFDDRIREEERYLIEFFGQRYISYKQKVPSGILGIKGYRHTE